MRAALIKVFVYGTLAFGLAACGGGSNSSGNCNLPTDRAADGTLCGDRAASVRPGGK